MMQTAPTSEQITTAIADADSMRYYPAFDLPGRAALPAPSATRPSGRCSCSSCNGPAED